MPGCSFSCLFEHDPSDNSHSNPITTVKPLHQILFCGMSVTVSNLFADTINAVETAVTCYNSVKDDKSLRDAFHEAGRSQGLVRQAL